MAANAPPEVSPGNPCCLAWQGKYITMKRRRDCCKEARDILQKAMAATIDEKANLEKKLREMTDNRDTKENDSAVKASLEKEISDLKSELLSLQQRLEQNLKEKSEEIKILQDQASSREKKFNELKDLLKEETLRADNSEEEREKVCKELNKTKALIVKNEDIKPDDLVAKQEISVVKNLLASERQKTELERKKAESERKKADQYLSELVVLRTTAHKTKVLRTTATKTSSDLLTLTSNLETVKKQLEFEKQKTLKERKRADMESAKAREQMYELSTKTCSVSPQKVRDIEKAKVRLLKKEIKFERKCAKHSKKVAEFEKFRREIQAEELGRLKLEFGSLTHRMNLLDGFSRDCEGRAGLAKAEGRMKPQMPQSQKNRNGEKHSDARCQLVASSGSQEQARKLSAQLIAKSRHGVSESVSGTISQLESPTGGSRKSQTSGVISSETSFSDRLASQGREQFSITTSTEIAKDKPNIQPTKSSVFRITDIRKNGNHCLVAENCPQKRQRDSHEVVNELSRKRKRVSVAVESRKHLSSDDKKKNLQNVEKLGTLHSMVVETGYRPLEEDETLVPDIVGGSSANCSTIAKKRSVSCEKKEITQNSLEFNRSAKTRGNKAGGTQVTGKTMCQSTAKGHDAATLFLGDVVATDYMKLLDLDKPEEESYYRMARESLLSPDLPQVDLLGGEIVNEDKNPADLVASNIVDLCDTINSSEASSLNIWNASVTVKTPPESSTLHGHNLKYFVVFSYIEDQNSIIKIFHAANNCVQRCPSVTTVQWVVPAILFSLKMEENLLAQERVCVFLTLLLHNFSVVSSMKIGNTLNDDSCSCLDSFSKHIYDVTANIEARGILSELLEELFNLLQDLLSEQRVLYCVTSSETSESDISIPVTLNGGNVALLSRIALTDHLVAGSAILAAMCTALDRVKFIREASFEILHKRSHEKTSMSLTILHVFAYIAGEKMMSSSEHAISISVLKSIVMFLENRHFGTAEGDAKFHPGQNKCQFSDRSSSLEAMASMLMEIIQEFTQYDKLHQSLTEKSEFRPAHKDFQCVLARDQSVTLCDILSLVELIACYMEWNWTSANIVAPLLKMLGMPLPMNLSVSIVSLLGQLSSIGVDAGGYENEGISNLREKLSAFLQCETTLKAGFAVQIATVSSLLKTLQLDFPIAFQGKTIVLPGCGDQSFSSSANLVTKWFSLLSDEQRVFTSDFLQTSVVR
ncbi:hypothetical protein EUTSA_v10016158mg [Eutrema salsugineum]|uniref:Uncharacterized protein n=1 Tax=Eutrema salsugineum TaxID=72664 RepID=V4LNG3_EUTSA|nr:hypothetical protein EUTSA_v10016158mg [Eutrema salsugineum]